MAKIENGIIENLIKSENNLESKANGVEQPNVEETNNQLNLKNGLNNEGLTDEDLPKKKNAFKALKIGFDLPSSAYATIGLRQLFRQNFDKLSQKAVKNL